MVLKTGPTCIDIACDHRVTLILYFSKLFIRCCMKPIEELHGLRRSTFYKVYSIRLSAEEGANTSFGAWKFTSASLIQLSCYELYSPDILVAV
jgi:hypothetical protein